MNIVTNSYSTDDRIIDELLAGIVVRVDTEDDSVDVVVESSGRNAAGFVTIEGFVYGDDAGEADQSQPFSVALVDVTEIEIY
jgi:hypothetical protein